MSKVEREDGERGENSAVPPAVTPLVPLGVMQGYATNSRSFRSTEITSKANYQRNPITVAPRQIHVHSVASNARRPAAMTSHLGLCHCDPKVFFAFFGHLFDSVTVRIFRLHSELTIELSQENHHNQRLWTCAVSLQSSRPVSHVYVQYWTLNK